MKNILVVQGGRSNGNTSRFIISFAKGAEDAGHDFYPIAESCLPEKPGLVCECCYYILKKQPRK